jgi:hypothetical protein
MNRSIVIPSILLLSRLTMLASVTAAEQWIAASASRQSTNPANNQGLQAQSGKNLPAV